MNEHTKTFGMDTETVSRPARFTLAMLSWLLPDGPSRLATFRSQAAPLFEQYGLVVERVLTITGKGQIVGENRFASPDLIQIISFPSGDAFKAYVADPRYQSLAAERDMGMSCMIVIAGTLIDLGALAVPGSGALTSRLYGFGLVRFKPNGAAGMDAFNVQAQGLFARHGMHLESSLTVQRVMTPIGDADTMDPQRVVVFFLDEASALPAYAADPEYAALAPLRDAGLETYDLFLGSAKSMGDTE